MPYGNSNAASGWFGSRSRGVVPVAWPSLRGRPASVISATLHLPSAIASAACAGKRHVGGAAKLGGIDMAELCEIEILGHGGGAGARRIAGAEKAVDIVAREPGIGERAERHLGVQLRHRLIRRVPRRMLVRAGDIGLALDGHSNTSPARRDRSPD